jgi:multiple sugar transport system permease protein
MVRSRAHIWFVAPALILMFVILLLPIGIAGCCQFTNYSLGNTSADWVGFQNYERIFTRSTYGKMFIATFTYVGVVVPLTVGLGLGAALLINSLKNFGDLYKTIYFLPVMAALLAMAIVWEFALHPTIGIVNRTLETGCGTLESWSWYAEGCARTFPLWLTDRDYAIWTVAFIGVWQGFGFNMVLYLAGLTSIPRELYHAAEMDGARSGWDRFWPGHLADAGAHHRVRRDDQSCIRSFQVFDTVEAFYPQGGGPSKSVYVMMFAIYEKAIQQNLMGIGAAITVVFLGFVMMLTLLQRWLVERRVHYS